MEVCLVSARISHLVIHGDAVLELAYTRKNHSAIRMVRLPLLGGSTSRRAIAKCSRVFYWAIYIVFEILVWVAVVRPVIVHSTNAPNIVVLSQASHIAHLHKRFSQTPIQCVLFSRFVRHFSFYFACSVEGFLRTCCWD